MALRTAINGFGRIGRCLLRAIIERAKDDIDVVAINSRAPSETLAHLLQYDSVHRFFDAQISSKENSLVINGKEIYLTRISDDPTKLPWRDFGVDIVLESTGKFKDKESNIGHLKAGARKVIIGAPGKGVDATFVMGVNENTYDPESHHIVSNASCTTNCLAPVVKVLHANFKILRALMTTIHSYTMDQRLLDGSHKDLRRSRAAALSMVPTSTGAATAVTQVIPELKGKMHGLAIRVPTPNVSIIDLVADVGRDATVEVVNAAYEQAANGELKGIIYYNTKPLVSVDFTSSPYSAIVDSPLTQVIEGKMVKVFAWYDNEYGFVYRMIELALHMGKYL